MAVIGVTAKTLQNHTGSFLVRHIHVYTSVYISMYTYKLHIYVCKYTLFQADQLITVEVLTPKSALPGKPDGEGATLPGLSRAE